MVVQDRKAATHRGKMLKHSPPSAFEPQEIERGFDLRAALSFTWRQWKFIAAVACVVFVVGMTYMLTQTPLYTATCQILLNPQREKTPGVETALSDASPDTAMIESQMEIIRSTVFLRRVVEKEHLASEPASADRAPEGQSTPLRSFFSSMLTPVYSFVQSWWPDLNKTEAKPAPVVATSKTIPPGEMAAIEALKQSLSVSRIPPQGYLLSISVTSPDPVRAAQLANAISDAYLVDKLDARFESAKRASDWLSDRLVGLREQLRQSEEAVAQFRADHGFIQSGNFTLNQQQLSELNAKLIDARADLAQKKSRVDLLNSLQAKGASLQSMPDIAEAGSLPSLRQQVGALSAQEADLLARYGDSYPPVVTIRAQRRDVERTIETETQRLATRVRSDYELAQARVSSLEKSLQQATGQTNIDDATAIRLRELERTAAVNKTLFEEFLKQAKVTQEQSTFEPQDIRVITPALPPGAPSHPDMRRYVVVSLLMGLFIGLGGALAKEKLDGGFTTPDQIEELLGLPLLTSVSQLTARERRVNGTSVPPYEYLTAKPLSRYGESIRWLRSGIQMADVDHPAKIIQVTSAVPNEGKTTIALSLAASAASAKLKVLFIDADLRHPAATRALNRQKEDGLVDFLLGRAEVKDVIRFQENGGYWVLTAGNKTQNATDLLESVRMKSMLEAFKEAYDLIVLDTSPVAPVVDPLVIAQLCDKVVLVVRWGSTARELVKGCAGKIPGHRKIAGVAFNHVNDRLARKYGKYTFSDYYGNRSYDKYHQA